MELGWADKPEKINNSIFTDAEITEIFETLKKVVAGDMSKTDSKAYAVLLSSALKSRGINPQPYEHLFD